MRARASWLEIGALPASVCALLAVACAPGPGRAVPAEWPAADPAAQGLDRDRLAALAGRMERGDYGAVTSFLVVRRGVLVLERYFRGAGPDSLQALESVTKSVTSSLVGLAVDSGLIRGPGAPLAAFLTQYDDLFAADPRKRSITIEHLLTMTSGLAWDESRPPLPDAGEQADWLRIVLRQPLVEVPGARFRYSSGNALLLSGVLERLYGMAALQVAVRGLFGPLGITSYRWLPLPRGLTPGGSALELRPRDLAKIGQLFLDRGMFRGRRVLSEEWVRLSTAAHSDLSDGSRYGYMWRVVPPVLAPPAAQPQTPAAARAPGSPAGAPAESPLAGAFFAAGFGDQYLFVLPGLDMVVVVTAVNWESHAVHPLEFLTSEILPTALGSR